MSWDGSGTARHCWVWADPRAHFGLLTGLKPGCLGLQVVVGSWAGMTVREGRDLLDVKGLNRFFPVF